MTLMHEIEAGAKIVRLARAIVEAAGARTDAAEIEAKHGAADAIQGLGGLIDDLGVHRAALLRVRMREDDGGAHRGRGSRLVEQRFEPADRPPDLTQWHGMVQCRRRPSGPGLWFRQTRAPAQRTHRAW